MKLQMLNDNMTRFFLVRVFWLPNFKPAWVVAKFMTILLMEEILHQLRLVVYPIIYKVLYIQTVVV